MRLVKFLFQWTGCYCIEIWNSSYHFLFLLVSQQSVKSSRKTDDRPHCDSPHHLREEQKPPDSPLHLREVEIKEIWRGLSCQFIFISQKLQTWILKPTQSSSSYLAVCFSKQSAKTIIMMNVLEIVWNLALHQDLLQHPHHLPSGGWPLQPLQPLPSTLAGEVRLGLYPGRAGHRQWRPSRYTSVRTGPWDASTDPAHSQSILYTVNLWQQPQKISRLFYIQ